MPITRGSMPNTTALSFTGDFDLRCAVALTDWTPGSVMTLICKSNLYYRLSVTAAGRLEVGWYNGATSKLLTASANIPGIQDGQLMCVRGTLDVDNGASGHDVKFYYKAASSTTPYDDAISNSGWTQLGSTRTGVGVTQVATTSAALEFGSRSGGTTDLLVGDLYCAVVMDGINGTVVASPDFTNGVPFNAARTYVTNEVAQVSNRKWKAGASVLIGNPPLGLGDGSGPDRKALVSRAIGWGEDATGGLGYATIHVTNNSNTGAGSLRQACADSLAAGGAWIVFDGDYTITLATTLFVPKNTTLDARGRTVIVNGPGGAGGPTIRIGTQTGGTNDNPDSITAEVWNVILENFKMDTGFASGNNADQIQILYKTMPVWLDHLTLNNTLAGDELINIGYGSTDFTVSWAYIHDHYKAWLNGSGQQGIADGWDRDIRVTAHHIYFNNIPDRLCRQGGYGKVHLLNNLIKDWGSGGGAFVVQEGQMLAEGNVADPLPGATGNQLKAVRSQEAGLSRGYAKSLNNWLKESSTVEEFTPANVETPSYTYTADTADATLESRLVAYAGSNPTTGWTVLAPNTDVQGNTWTTTVANATATPATIACTTTIPTPIKTTNSTVTPGVIGALSTIINPAFAGEGNVVVQPAAVAAVAALPQASVTAGSVVIPVTIAATVTIYQSGSPVGSTVSPAVIEVIVGVHEQTVLADPPIIHELRASLVLCDPSLTAGINLFPPVKARMVMKGNRTVLEQVPPQRSRRQRRGARRARV